jgi:hypothetical protein
MVRREMANIDIESIVTGGLAIEEVHTQLSNTNDLFSSEIVDGRTLVSIIISDDKLKTEINVRNDDRQARYDGVITCYPSWIFIVENKPSRENIWVGQLNPNVSEDKDIKIIEKPCCLSWREVITGLNTLVQNRMISGFELQAVEDFIEYVDNARNTVHLDHLKRFMPIAGYGSSRSPETVHADHQIRSKPISFGGGILKYQFAIGQLRPKSKFTSNLEERWTQRPWPQGGYPCGRFEKS